MVATEGGHVVVWLYEDPHGRIPPAALGRLDSEIMALSPFVTLELQYLNEIGRISAAPQEMVEELAPKLELRITDPPAAQICHVAHNLGWTRDPFDRLICAQAITSDATLLTKDRVIRKNLPRAWWPSDTDR